MARAKSGAARRMRDPSALTPNEAKVWGMIQAGKTIEQIAEELGRKVNSVKTLLYTIQDKQRCLH